eukprot:1157565-Pelagomonas_calceolata.AAC.1
MCFCPAAEHNHPAGLCADRCRVFSVRSEQVSLVCEQKSLQPLATLLTTPECFGAPPFHCSILYQRGVYPQETFDVAKKYGCNLWLNNDEGLTKYLHTVLQQTKGATAVRQGSHVWLEQGKLKQLVLVITEADTKEVLERWTFDIDTNRDVLEGKGVFIVPDDMPP